MSRDHPRPDATAELRLEPCAEHCHACGHRFRVAYHRLRTIATLDGLLRLRVVIRRCVTPTCDQYQRSYHPEGEGAIALPHGEFGLDVIALVGALRHVHHRSVPEIHRELRDRGLMVAERTVTNLLDRYEELVAHRLAANGPVPEQLRTQGRVILAIDGLQPDVGHEVLWVIRDCLSGEVLVARSLLGSTEGDLAPLRREVAAMLPAPIAGVISDGQQSLRKAVAQALPDVPHQLCQFHYLREAAKAVYAADRHAKKELKKRVRGVRPIERALDGREDAEAAVLRGYCQAVRSAITDDGRAPLEAAGLRLHARLEAIGTSIDRLAEKGGSPTN